MLYYVIIYIINIIGIFGGEKSVTVQDAGRVRPRYGPGRGRHTTGRYLSGR